MVLLGLAVRLALAPLAGHPFDTFVWYDTGQRVFLGQPFYAVTAYSYPPTWAGILGVVDGVYRPLAAWLGAQPLTANQVTRALGHPILLAAPLLVDWLFLLLVKLPLIAGDLVLGLILRSTVAHRLNRPALADRAFAWYFLNPYIIWISAVWGMFDVLPTLFALVAILLFLDERDALSGIAFGVAVSLKYFPVLLALGLLVAYRGSLNRGRLVRLLSGFLLLLGGVSLPFLLASPATYLQGVLSPTSGVNTGRLSVWEFAGALGIANLPIALAAVDIALTFALVALLNALRGRLTPHSLPEQLWIESGLTALLVFYVVNYSVNPQYFVWIIPFFILDWVVHADPPRILATVTALVLGYILTSVEHYSFFLPILTINIGLAPYVLPMPPLLPLMYALPIVVWIVMVDQLKNRVRSAGGLHALRRVLLAILRASHLVSSPAPPETGS